MNHPHNSPQKLVLNQSLHISRLNLNSELSCECDSFSNQPLHDKLNNAFLLMGDNQSSSFNDQSSLRLSQISFKGSISGLSGISSINPKPKGRQSSSRLSDSSSFNLSIEQQNQDSFLQVMETMKRRAKYQEMEEEGIRDRQFKKKRVLNSNEVVENIMVEEREVERVKFVKRYPTRKQTLKQIDDQFEKEMKEING